MQRTGAKEPTEIDDELLVIRCQLGERDAFDALIERWAASVTGYARRMSEDGDAATDLTQDIWLRVIRGIDRLQDARRFRPWLFGIAHRAFIDTLRRRYRVIPTVSEHHDLPTDEDIDESHADLEQMARGLERLPPLEREVLTLFYLQELSVDETAAALSVPLGTVKSRLYRARKLLRGELGKGDFA